MKEYLDTSPPERYLRHLREINFPIDEDIKNLFDGNNSPQFYEGMICGIKAFYNILSTIPFSEKEMDGFTHISLDLQKVIIQYIKH